ncbi:MAG: acyltransferase [Gemmataceae bacterium]
MVPTTRPRLEALTGLRYIAAVCVLLTHMSYNLPPGFGKSWLFTLGAYGMPLFFTLSGFLMAYNYSLPFRQKFGRTLRTYYVARFARIYPVYAACLLLSFSFMGNFFHDLRDHPKDTATTLAFDATLTQSWVHLPVFQDSQKPRPLSQGYLGVAWSVSTEAFFYLVFPLVALPLATFVTGRGRMLVGVAAVYAVFIFAVYLVTRRLAWEVYDAPGFGNSKTWWKLYLCPYMRFGEFLIGALVGQYFLLRADKPPATGGRWWAGAAMLLGATAVMVVSSIVLQVPQRFGWLTRPRFLEMLGYNVLYAPLCAVIIYQLAALPSFAQRALGCRPMVVLGEMSYCLYLLHPLGQSLFYPRAAGEGPMTNKWVVLYNNLGMVVGLHLMCLGMYRYWEVPAREWLRAKLDPRPKAPLTVVPADRRAA